MCICAPITYMFVYSENIFGRIHKKLVTVAVSGERDYRYRMRRDLIFI